MLDMRGEVGRLIRSEFAVHARQGRCSGPSLDTDVVHRRAGHTLLPHHDRCDVPHGTNAVCASYRAEAPPSSTPSPSTRKATRRFHPAPDSNCTTERAKYASYTA